MNISPGRIIKNRFITNASEKIKDKGFLNIKKIKHIGMAVDNTDNNPADITFCTLSFLPSALYLVISRDTVMGVPEQQKVKSSENTDKAIWYIPIPSAPMVRDRNILYKNPKNFSHTENTVTTATVLKNVLNNSPLR